MECVTENRVTVRRAVESDDAVLLEIDSFAWDASSGFPSLGAADHDTFFTEARGPDAHLVAEIDGRVVGYLRLQNKYTFEKGAGVLAINGVAVTENARGQGVGSALLDAATAEGKRRGARKLTLNVHGTNLGARRLYERHGYVIERNHPQEFLIEGNYVDKLSLAKSL
jgi:ribosomal protein S18 acetylase RimI-like enzyme